MSDATLTPRPAARILLVAPDARILLFRFMPLDDRAPFWCTPGGALDPGETYAEAAVRELAEETGLAAPCGPEVAQRWIEFLTLEGAPVRADERYFLIRAPGHTIDTAGHTELERAVMREHAWFDAAGLAALPEAYYPEDLPAMLADLGVW